MSRIVQSILVFAAFPGVYGQDRIWYMHHGFVLRSSPQRI